MNVAQRQPNSSYKGVRNHQVLYLHPNSVLNALHPEWIMYQDIVKTNRYYMREVSELDHRWLIEIAPHFYEVTLNYPRIIGIRILSWNIRKRFRFKHRLKIGKNNPLFRDPYNSENSKLISKKIKIKKFRMRKK